MPSEPSPLPILYSFRRCPYAIRARLAITYAEIPVEIREVQLKQKPEQMLAISPKGTVPVLQLPDGKVIDESLDIMRWALAQYDPEHWLHTVEDAERLIQWNDGEFKYYLDRYKYADRYPEFPESYYRSQAELFVAELEAKLSQSLYLAGNHFSLLDAALLPFIRQFAAVDGLWFLSSDYRHLNNWLNGLLASDLFVSVMAKYTVWKG
ncbi:glutathione S-transferase [Methyloglobulus sp.]|uniref:glutathione S-transferase n=1 Tax=Methyloglobulus sp. TaxID=2518622 RepID=UPI0032B8556C